MATGLSVPTFASANTAVNDAKLTETVSPLIMPDSAALFVLMRAVADVVALNSRDDVVMPVTVSVFAVMLAVVDGWVMV